MIIILIIKHFLSNFTDSTESLGSTESLSNNWIGNLILSEISNNIQCYLKWTICPLKALEIFKLLLSLLPLFTLLVKFSNVVVWNILVFRLNFRFYSDTKSIDKCRTLWPQMSNKLTFCQICFNEQLTLPTERFRWTEWLFANSANSQGF